MGMDFLLNAVKNSITQHAGDQAHTGFDPSQLLGHIDQIFQQHQSGGQQNVQSASRDPFGDAGAREAGKLGTPYGFPLARRN